MQSQPANAAEGLTGLLDRLPDELREYVEAGHPVRTSADDPEAGRCGAMRARDTGFCRRVAGWGTDHTGIGRCRRPEHADLHGGLAPWVGELDEEEWAEVTGANTLPRNADGTFGSTHGATEYGLQPIERLFYKKLDPEEQEAFRLTSTDPIEVINLQIRLRQTAQFQVQRYIHALRMSPEGRKNPGKVHAETLGAQKVLDMITQTIARLVEGKARWKELEGQEQRDRMLRDLLGSLTFKELGEMKRNPALLASMTG